MKKRILALAMTIAMVFSSMAVLSTVSFAADDHDECVHFDATLATVDAYHATVNVDGSADAYVMVQEYLANGTRYGVAWDYDYIYVIFAAATKKLTGTVEFTVGATDVKVDVATATVTGVEGAKAKGNANYLEVAIPLSEVTLHFTQTTAYAPLTVKVTSDATSGATSEKSVNVRISGNSLVVGYETYVGNKVPGRSMGLWTQKEATSTINITKTTNSDSSVTFAQPATETVGGRAQMTIQHVTDIIDPRLTGVGLNAAWDITVADLPASSAPSTVPHGYQTGVVGGVVLSLVTRMTEKGKANPPAVYGGFIYNDATDGLTLLVVKNADRTAYEKIDLGVNAGEKVRVTYDITADVNDTTANVAVYVNGVFVKNVEVMPHSASIAGSRGGVEVSLVTVPNAKCVATINNVSISVAPEVDNAKVKSVAKNGGVDTDDLVNAVLGGAFLNQYYNIPATAATANVGSLTYAATSWDYEAEKFYVIFQQSVIDAVQIKNGSSELVVSLERKGDDATNGWLDTATVSGVEGAKVYLAGSDFGFVTVEIPLHKVTVRTEAGKVFADFEITAVAANVTVNDKFSALMEMTADINFNQPCSERHGIPAVSKIEYVNGGQASCVYSYDNSTAGTGRGYVQFGENFDKTAANGMYENITDGVRWISHTFKIEKMTAVAAASAGFDRDMSRGNARILVTMTQPRTAGGRHGIDFNICNVIPENGTAADATINVVFGDSRRVDTGAELGEEFNLKIEQHLVTNAINVYVNGALVGTLENGSIINGTGYVWPSSGAYFGINTWCAAADQELKFEMKELKTGYANAYACTTNLQATLAKTANTVVDLPEYEDEDEALELKAIQATGEGDDYAQRFVATIDSLDYKYAGFQTAKLGTTDYVRNTYRVFTGHTSIIDGEEEITADEGEYFVTYTLTGDNVMTGVFFIRAFVVDADRNFTYGDTYKVEINGGVVTSAELVTNPAIFG